MLTLGSTPAPVLHPHRGDLLDVVLVVLGAFYAYAGYRRGLLVGVFSFAGFVVGALIGARYGPAIARALVGGSAGGSAIGERAVALIALFVIASLVQYVGVLIGARLRFLEPRMLRALDAAGGAVFDVAGLLFVAWLIASVLATAPFPDVTRQIRRSAILATIDEFLPGSANQLFADLNRLLQRHDLPPLTSPFAGIPVPAPGLAPPNAGVVPPALRAAGAQVVKVTGTATSCSRDIEGSGFVYAPQHVMTNAHVVAGVRHPLVALPSPGGRVLAATVVLYDPNRDVAVLYAPGLTRAPLAFAGPVGAGADAVVAGYPENGPLTAIAARVAGEQNVTGPNIYGNRAVTRQVYTLRADVRPGNSGGPLLSPRGRVDGVVFAASVDETNVGYALTAAEVSSDAAAGARVTTSTSTGSCD